MPLNENDSIQELLEKLGKIEELQEYIKK